MSEADLLARMPLEYRAKIEAEVNIVWDMKRRAEEDNARLREEVKGLEQRLGNLLARIHGDGGHYITEHGWEKAEADADAKVVDKFAEREELLYLLRIYHHCWMTDNRVPTHAATQALALLAKHPVQVPNTDKANDKAWECGSCHNWNVHRSECWNCGMPRP